MKASRGFVFVSFHNSDQCNSDMQRRACQDGSIVIHDWISGRSTGITMVSGNDVIVQRKDGHSVDGTTLRASFLHPEASLLVRSRAHCFCWWHCLD